MKRFLTLFICFFCLAALVSAQNANRSGFLIEAGIGGFVGDTPRTSISVTNDLMQFKCVSGAAMDFGLGYRFSFKSHWAYEIKAEAQTAISNIANTLVGRLLPIGFRYTSTEIWKNYSLYAHCNIGIAIPSNKGIIRNDIFFNNMKEQYIKAKLDHPGLNPAYALGVGANITTHFYIEACWNGQAFVRCYGKNGKELLNCGVVGVVLGYRL